MTDEKQPDSSHQVTLEEITGEYTRKYDESGDVIMRPDPGFDYVGAEMDKLHARISELEVRKSPDFVPGKKAGPKKLEELLDACHPEHPQAYLCEACEVLGRWTPDDVRRWRSVTAEKTKGKQ